MSTLDELVAALEQLRLIAADLLKARAPLPDGAALPRDAEVRARGASGLNARHLLVDLENVQPTAAQVKAWLAGSGAAWVFHGPHQEKLLPAFRALGHRVTVVPISKPGGNSLDFHLVLYLGYLAAKQPAASFSVLSRDTGYDPAIVHARMLSIKVVRITQLSPVRVAVAPAAAHVVKPTGNRAASASPKAPAKEKAVPAKKPVSVSVKKDAGASKKVATPVVKAAAKKNPSPSIGKSVAPAPKVIVPARKKAAERAVGAIYRDVLDRLREKPLGRPRTQAALERHVQTFLGNEPMPDKVGAVIDRLFTVDAIRVVGQRLIYFPHAFPRGDMAAPTANQAAPSA